MKYYLWAGAIFIVIAGATYIIFSSDVAVPQRIEMPALVEPVPVTTPIGVSNAVEVKGNPDVIKDQAITYRYTPECSLIVSTTHGTRNFAGIGEKNEVNIYPQENIDVTWASSHATSATAFATSEKISLNGKGTYRPSRDESFIYNFIGDEGSTTCSFKVHLVGVNFNKESLESYSSTPVITGFVLGAVELVSIKVTDNMHTNVFFENPMVKVDSRGQWSVPVTKQLADGVYDVTIFLGQNADTFITGKLVVSSKGPGILTVSPVPQPGSVVFYSGDLVPFTKIKLTNTGAGSAVINGFTLQRHGNATANIIEGLSVRMDASGGGFMGAEGYPPFEKSDVIELGYTNTINPGETHMYTIVGYPSKDISADVGKTFSIAIAGIDTSAKVNTSYFPVYGAEHTVGVSQ